MARPVLASTCDASPERHCCIDLDLSVWEPVGTALLGSDCPRQFGERVRDATTHPRVDTKFVVAAPDVLHQRVTPNDHRRGLIAFEAAHRTQPRFQSTVVILDPIVRVLLRVVKRAGKELIDDNAEWRGPVRHDLALLRWARTGQFCAALPR